jgi:hypothetical protein
MCKKWDERGKIKGSWCVKGLQGGGIGKKIMQLTGPANQRNTGEDKKFWGEWGEREGQFDFQT